MMLKQKLINEYHMQSVSDDVESILNKYSTKLIDNIISNAHQVAKACKVKTITLGHLNTVNRIQLKSIGIYPNKEKQTGGHAGTVMPSEFFGINSGLYSLLDGNCYDMFYDLASDVSKSGIESTFPPNQAGGGVSNGLFINEKEFKEQLKKSKDKYDIKISKEAVDLIRLSVELNFDMLIKFLQKRKIKHLTAEKIQSNVMSNNKRFKHFV